MSRNCNATPTTHPQSPHGGAPQMQKFQFPSAENQKLSKVLSDVGWNIALHALPTAKKSA